MFVANEYVAIIDGPWKGHRGIVAVTPEQNEPSAVLVTVERPGMGRGFNGEVFNEYFQYWIAPQHLAHLSTI